MPQSEAPVKQSAGASTISSDSVRSARWMTLLLLFGMATALRFAHLVAKPFWFDECFSVEVARIDWRNFLHVLWWREANMSLYYVLLRAWLHFGQSEFFIRSLSVVISLAALPAIYWLARLLYNRRVAVIATALLAFNAYAIRYAQEARSYAVFLLLATLSSALFIVCLRNPVHRNWNLYVALSVLAVYAHLYALLLIVVHWIVLRWLGRPDLGTGQNPPVFVAQVRRVWKTIAIAVMPLLVFVAKTGAGPIKWIPRPGLRDLLKFFEHLAGSDSWPLLALCVAASVAAIRAVASHLWKRDESWDVWRVQFLLIWLLFPMVVTVLLSFGRPLFLGRYMIFCLPALIILTAAGLERWQQPSLLAAALVVVLFLSLGGVFFVYGHDFDNERDGSGAASHFILDHSLPGDGALFHIAEGRVPYEFFRSVRAGENTASPAYARLLGPEIVFPRNGAGLDYRDFTGKPTAEFLRTMAPSHPRLWVMLIDNGPTGHPDPTTLMLTNVLPELLPKVQRWQFPRVELRLYSK